MRFIIAKWPTDTLKFTMHDASSEDIHDVFRCVDEVGDPFGAEVRLIETIDNYIETDQFQGFLSEVFKEFCIKEYDFEDNPTQFYKPRKEEK